MANDAAVLRTAAAIVEVQSQQGRPHLMGLVNRLLALAADLTPARPGEQAAGAIRAALSPAMAPRSDPGRDQASAPTEAATGSQTGAQQGWGLDARP